MGIKVPLNRPSILFVLVILVLVNIVAWNKICGQQSNKNILSLKYFLPLKKSSYIPHFKLKNSYGKIFNSKDLKSELNILIFFSISDCPGCLYEAEYWSMAHKVGPEEKLQIWGIAETNNKEDIEEFCKEYDIIFPVIYDEEGKMKRKLSLVRGLSSVSLITPFKIFLDSSGQVIYSEGPVKDLNEQAAFVDKVLNFIDSSTVYETTKNEE